MRQPTSDRQLDAGQVAGLIAEQFPHLAAGTVTRLGQGWDHEVFSLGGEWILRFPRRQTRVRWLLREMRIVELAAERAGLMVPAFELTGKPSAAFPYPFVGYRRLPGVAADLATVADERLLAGDVGRLLSLLHRIDPILVPPTPDGWERESMSDQGEYLTSVAGSARPVLPPEVATRAEPYLSGRVAAPPQEGQPRFVHNDMCPDHLIVDEVTGRLRGLIDFTDAMVGDPVVDFAGLIGVGGYRFIGAALAAYDLPLDGGFGARLEWLSRVLTLTWLAEAADHDPAAVSKHQIWVARAFEDGKCLPATRLSERSAG